MELASLLHAPAPVLTLMDPQMDVQVVSRSDPAAVVMTDLRLAAVSVTQQDASIEAALATMKNAGVRLLFVLDDARRLVGSVTSYHIQGERPVLFMQSTPGIRSWRDVEVRNVMDPISAWRVLDLDDVARLTVNQVVALLLEAGTHHLVVTEQLRAGQAIVVRGLFSASRVQHLLGESLDIRERPTTFAEIERVIA